MSIGEVLLILIPVCLGVLFIALARWARYKNSALKSKFGDVRYGNFVDQLKHRKYGAAAQSVLFGDQPNIAEVVGKLLVVLVLVAVFIFLFSLVVLVVSK